MAILIVRLGSERASGEGLRIGTVRRPPRRVLRLVHFLEDGLGDDDVEVGRQLQRRAEAWTKATAPASGRDTPSRLAVRRWKAKNARTKRPRAFGSSTHAR
jgi:hypothetical protein